MFVFSFHIYFCLQDIDIHQIISLNMPEIVQIKKKKRNWDIFTGLIKVFLFWNASHMYSTSCNNPTSCVGASRGFLNSASETGSENLANIEGRSWPGNCWANCSANGEYLFREKRTTQSLFHHRASFKFNSKQCCKSDQEASLYEEMPWMSA